MAKRSKVAVIGAGYWGTNLVRNFHALDALHTICDNDADMLDAMSEKYPGTETVPQSATVFGSSDIDAVAIATPVATHGRLVREATVSSWRGRHAKT